MSYKYRELGPGDPDLSKDPKQAWTEWEDVAKDWQEGYYQKQRELKKCQEQLEIANNAILGLMSSVVVVKQGSIARSFVKSKLNLTKNKPDEKSTEKSTHWYENVEVGK